VTWAVQRRYDGGEPKCLRVTSQARTFWDAVHGYFLNFLGTGSPNSETSHAPEFSAYEAPGWHRLGLNDTFGDATGFKESKCDYWDRHNTYEYFMRFVEFQEAGSKPGL
jgi:hypothetical protein